MFCAKIGLGRLADSAGDRYRVYLIGRETVSRTIAKRVNDAGPSLCAGFEEVSQSQFDELVDSKASRC